MLFRRAWKHVVEPERFNSVLGALGVKAMLSVCLGQQLSQLELRASDVIKFTRLSEASPVSGVESAT